MAVFLDEEVWGGEKLYLNSTMALGLYHAAGLLSFVLVTSFLFLSFLYLLRTKDWCAGLEPFWVSLSPLCYHFSALLVSC